MGGFGQGGWGQIGFGSPAQTLATPPNAAYYLRLVTSEYQISTRMLAWLQANLRLFQDIVACSQFVGVSLSLSQAFGAQLDLLGTIVGAARTVPFQPSNSVSPILDDGTYRTLLQAVVAQNHWDGTLDGLLTSWQTIFPGGLLIVDDLQNMTVNIYLAAPLSSILQDLVLKGYILPRPQGVLYNITLATLPMFGCDRNDSWVAGADLGHAV